MKYNNVEGKESDKEDKNIAIWINIRESHILHAIYIRSESNIHYENTPMQHTAIFHARENDNFHFYFFLLFSYFCSKH